MNIFFNKKNKIRGIDFMEAADLDEVMLIEKRSFTMPWSRSAFLSELDDNPVASYIVYRDDQGQVIGYGGIWVILDEAHLTTLAVESNRRSRGYGGQLLGGLIELAFKNGAHKMTLEVRVSNTHAIDFYKKFGFQLKGIRKKYYNDEDAYIMWKDGLYN